MNRSGADAGAGVAGAGAAGGGVAGRGGAVWVSGTKIAAASASGLMMTRVVQVTRVLSVNPGRDVEARS